QRRHVEQPNAELPGVLDSRDRSRIADGLEEPPDGGATEAEASRREPPSPEIRALGWLERHPGFLRCSGQTLLTPRVSLSYRSVLGPPDRILNDWSPLAPHHLSHRLW